MTESQKKQKFPQDKSVSLQKASSSTSHKQIDDKDATPIQQGSFGKLLFEGGLKQSTKGSYLGAFIIL